MREIVVYFLKLGLLGFGGPVALAVQMQKDLVEKRGWQSKEEFAQALALIKAMPGPLAFSTASYLGTIRKGFWGGVIAGWSLVLPAFILMVGFGYFYETLRENSYVGRLLLGMQAGSLAVIYISIRSLTVDYQREIKFWAILALTVFLFLTGVPEPVLIIFGGFLSYALSKNFFKNGNQLNSFAASSVILKLAWICFSSGAFVFGTGIAIIPLLQHALVVQESFVSNSLFMDALTFGQLTPGPVLITVTFLGYKIIGLWGAAVATFCIFIPSGIHMTTWFPAVVKRLAKKAWISKFTVGAIAAVVGALIVVTGKLGIAFNDKQQAICVVSVVVMLVRKLPAWFVILGTGLVGLAIF